MTISDEILANPILRELRDLLEKQTAKGLVKYGHTVNPGEFTMDGWLEHIREELLDGLVYATILKQKSNESYYLKLERENKRLREALEQITEYDRPGLLITTHTHNGMVSIAKEALEESK